MLVQIIGAFVDVTRIDVFSNVWPAINNHHPYSINGQCFTTWLLKLLGNREALTQLVLQMSRETVQNSVVAMALLHPLL